MRLTQIAAAASAALALSFAGAAPSQAATTWNAVGDFSTTSSTLVNGVWSYGWASGSTFNAFNTESACFPNLACWQTTGLEIYQVPLVAGNLTGGTIDYANTVVHPKDVLNLHPGQTLDGSNQDIDAVVRFTAPTAGSYGFHGFFEVLDVNPSGVSITVGGKPVNVSGFATMPNTTGPRTNFADSFTLAAGDTVDFRVNRAGVIWNDSTGLSVRVTDGVPEPTAWTLMIVGFGGLGAMLRLRRRKAAFA